MSDQDLKAELERLRRENEALKKGASSGIRMKVSEKGALSVYGMGRFSRNLVQRAVDKVAGNGGRNSRIHCCKRTAIEGEGITLLTTADAPPNFKTA